MLPESNAHSRDCYSFGVLVESLMSHLNGFGESVVMSHPLLSLSPLFILSGTLLIPLVPFISSISRVVGQFRDHPAGRPAEP